MHRCHCFHSYFILGHVTPTTPVVANWLQSHIITNITIVTHCCYSAMARCPRCRRSVTGSLHKHLSACPLNIIFLNQRAAKRVTPTRTSLKQKSLRQVINTSAVAARLSADTHSASASAPSKHLCSLMSTRDRAAKVLADEYAAKQSLFDDNLCMEEDRSSSFDSHGSYFDERSDSNLPKSAG